MSAVELIEVPARKHAVTLDDVNVIVSLYKRAAIIRSCMHTLVRFEKLLLNPRSVVVILQVVNLDTDDLRESGSPLTAMASYVPR